VLAETASPGRGERTPFFVQRASQRGGSLVKTRELTRSLTAREIRGQYKGSVLGWLWSLLNPLAQIVTFTLVFSVILRTPPLKGDPSGLHNYTLYLITGLIPWNLFAAGVSGTTGSLLAQASLITKVYFPRSTVVVSKTLAVAFTSLIEFVVVLIVLLVAGNMIVPWLPVIALLFALELVMVLGVGLMLSVANVYFRDIQYLLAIALQLLFYSTPIIYPITLVAARGPNALTLYRLNPLVRLVEAYRNVLYDLRWPSFVDVGYFAIWAVAILLLGMLVFRRFEGRLAEEL
jgi:ABC-2 type transport system permease protein